MPSEKTRGDGAESPSPRLPPFDNDDNDDAEAADDNAHGGVDGAEEGDSIQPARKKAKKKVKESVIDHTYRDYSQVEAPEDEDDAKSDAVKGKESSRSFQSFPAKLHAIVSNPNYQHIIRWMPHGRCWAIVDKYLLTTVLLPRYFAHGKFESFNRSVNGWGFKRLLRDGPDKRAYYHECFLRGRPELTKLMTRLCNPGKRLPDKSGEPDFYEISRKYPLPELPTVGIRPDQNDVHSLHAIRSPSAAAAAHSQSVQRILFASPPIHHASTGANNNRQATAIPQLPQPMYFPAGPMEHPAFQQSPFGFYAPSQFMMAPPQSMPGGTPGYYVVYQPPPLFMQSPHASATAPLPYAAALSGGQQPDMAALLAATALSSAGMMRDVQPAVRQTAVDAGVTTNEAYVKTKAASHEDAKPNDGILDEDKNVKTEEAVVGNSTAEV